VTKSFRIIYEYEPDLRGRETEGVVEVEDLVVVGIDDHNHRLYMWCVELVYIRYLLVNSDTASSLSLIKVGRQTGKMVIRTLTSSLRTYATQVSPSVKLLSLPSQSGKAASISVFFKGGSRFENDELPTGASSVLKSMLFKVSEPQEKVNRIERSDSTS
jgi:hypothetical protein